jgi:hypothetical protein
LTRIICCGVFARNEGTYYTGMSCRKEWCFRIHYEWHRGLYCSGSALHPIGDLFWGDAVPASFVSEAAWVGGAERKEASAQDPIEPRKWTRPNGQHSTNTTNRERDAQQCNGGLAGSVEDGLLE